MAEKIKKHWDITLIVGIGFVLTIAVIVGIGGLRPLINEVSAVATTVEVTATVSEWLTFTSSVTSTTLSPNLVDTAGATHIGSSTDITLTVGTNSSDGYSITASSSNAGLKATTTISTAIATTTLSAGVAGYGIQATSSMMTIDAVYKWATSTQDVGAATTSKAFATDSAATAADVAYMKIKAACLVSQAPGDYTDVITLTLTGTP